MAADQGLKGEELGHQEVLRRLGTLAGPCPRDRLSVHQPQGSFEYVKYVVFATIVLVYDGRLGNLDLELRRVGQNLGLSYLCIY